MTRLHLELDEGPCLTLLVMFLKVALWSEAM
jgi:hypothetical protein